MGWIVWVIVGVLVVAAGVIGQLTGIMDFRAKKGAATIGNVLAPIDGLFAPNRQEAMQELERQHEMPAPAPSPGDGDRDVYKGTIKIDLSQPR
ncbi:MAG: hypothetical protein ABIR17_03815 [Pseudolysinimonas sp.]|uniref:hypothetical protein n=1 Tax=Pseudolysinimonas sp. TaxID=2680009 RepID=UPI0032641790